MSTTARRAPRLSGPILLCFLLTPIAAYAAPPADEATADVAGVKVGIDAKTGKLRPLTAEESRALEQALTSQPQARAARAAGAMALPADAAAAKATAHRTAGGAMAMKLPASQLSSVVAHRDADGKLVITHADPADDHGHDHDATEGRVHE